MKDSDPVTEDVELSERLVQREEPSDTLSDVEGNGNVQENNKEEDVKESEEQAKTEDANDSERAANEQEKEGEEGGGAGVVDVTLYGADIMSDGLQLTTHASNCHGFW